MASTSSLSPSLTCAISVASSGEVSPMPASERRAISFSDGSASNSRLTPRSATKYLICIACTGSRLAALARLVPIKSF
ncbi:Uncharacterised protein [Mycobacterium tuberculosis]|uniref:Uncharacterized protein n=2 Tax=Mycobacterium tuberculosis TaxID=1773 RepID=A0A655AR30_MYCTX|nr:Uncharacterised protein [Mycobacterium tuberculosis]CKT58776.1 Uncharacterised protein [Mycobacterium tuberculosis]COW74745.1 Uncharacterised protein [Mycobacterium tuberculosis]